MSIRGTDSLFLDGNTNRKFEKIQPKEDPLVNEVSHVLRDWSVLVKERFVEGSFVVYDAVRVLIYDLIDLKRDLSLVVTRDQLKNTRQEVIKKIEQGNALLGLDVIVRDEDGSPLIPSETSTIDIFRAHESAVKRIRHFHNQTVTNQIVTPVKSLTNATFHVDRTVSSNRGFSLFKNDRTSSLSILSGDSNASDTRKKRMQMSLVVSVFNLTSRMTDDAEILISLFDAKESKFISENFLIKWTRLEEVYPERKVDAVFTDLGVKDLSREKILLVCQVIRIGSMDPKPEGASHHTPSTPEPSSVTINPFSSKFRSSNHAHKRLTEGIRRPFGVAVLDITNIVNETVCMEDDSPLFINIHPCTERDSLESVLKKIVFNTKLAVVTPSFISNLGISLASSPGLLNQSISRGGSGVGLWTSVKLVSGDLKASKTLDEDVARKMSFPDIILPNDVRNDLYVTILSAHFSSRYGASGSKNIEVTARVCDDRGHVVKDNVISTGGGSPLLTEYKSVVYHHDNEPKWFETFRITLPIEEFYGSHIQFTFRHRSSIDSKDKAEKPFAFAFVRLGNLNGTAIRDSQHYCLVYKIDKKHSLEGTSNEAPYLKLPATKLEMQERLTPINSSNTIVRSSSTNRSSSPTSPRPSSYFLRPDLFIRKPSISSSASSAQSWGNNPVSGSTATLTPQVTLPAVNNPKTITAYFNSMSPGLSLQLKDSFTISTVICSTKLTQNFDLMALLAVDLDIMSDSQIKECLRSFLEVDGEEIVKFLQDCLDALFKIFVVKEEKEIDRLVFDCLIRILSLISDTKYHNFKAVLDSYIKDTFSWTLAYNKLVIELVASVFRMIHTDYCQTTHTSLSDMRYFSRNEDSCSFNQIMDSLEYLFKFIVRSRSLHSNLQGSRGKKAFDSSLRDLFAHFCQLIEVEREDLLKLQGKFMRNLPLIIKDVITLFDAEEFSIRLASFLTSIPIEKLKSHKLTYMLDVIHTECLFKQSQCRKHLIPVMTQHIKIFMEKKDPVLLESCCKVLSEILRILFEFERTTTDSTKFDIQEVVFCCLKTIMDSVIYNFATPCTLTATTTTIYGCRSNDSQLLRCLVSLLISLFRQMTPFHFRSYFGHFKSDDDLMDFLIQVLMVFQNLISYPVFPSDCMDMILHEAQVILNSLKHISRCIKEFTNKRFEFQLWNNYFHCGISFLTQPLLQLENVSENKRNSILSKFGDMRKDAAVEVRSMWYSLGDFKGKFVPGIVGPFVEMTLIPDHALRKETIPIFFDMMHSQVIDPSKGHFREFEKEMITQLDKLVEGGRGDQEYREMVFDILGSLWESHSTHRKHGLEFCKTLSRLLKRLLEYRQVQSRSPSSTIRSATQGEENKENRMLCIVNILEFYNEIGRRELYLRYLYKLLDLHIQSENWIEAAYTLSYHANLLNWSDDPVEAFLKPYDSYSNFIMKSNIIGDEGLESHRQLKLKLYEKIIEFFDRGKLWEEGIKKCRDLADLYVNHLFDYNQMSELLQKMSSFYKKIMTELRPKAEYFRVCFYGKGFPNSIQNKTFICRGKEYEQLISFQSRLSNQYPSASMMRSLKPPGPEITESTGQYILATKVDPVMKNREDFHDRVVPEQIVNYYKVNEIQTFSFNELQRRTSDGTASRDSDNEFANIWIERTIFEIPYDLPGIVRLFPVIRSRTTVLSPLENAIECLDSKNKELKSSIIQQLTNSSAQVDGLTMRLKGVIEAAVNGGIKNYEKAFFDSDYEVIHSEDHESLKQLRNLIAEQVPLLEVGLSIQKDKISPNLKPLQDHLEVQMKLMKRNIEDKYGCRELPKEISDMINHKKKTVTDQVKPDEESTPSSKHHSYRSYSVWKTPNSISSVGWGSAIGRLTRKSDHNASQEKVQKRKQSSLWYDNESVKNGDLEASSLTLNDFDISRGVSMTSLATQATISSAVSTATLSSIQATVPLQPVVELNQCLLPQRPESIKRNRSVAFNSDISLDDTSGDLSHNGDHEFCQSMMSIEEDVALPPPILPPKPSNVIGVRDLTTNHQSTSEQGLSSRSSKRGSSGKSLLPLPPIEVSEKPLPPPIVPRRSKSNILSDAANHGNNNSSLENNVYKDISCVISKASDDHPTSTI